MSGRRKIKLMTPAELQAFVEDYTRAHYDDYVRDRDRTVKKAMADVVAEVRKREAQWTTQEVERFFDWFRAEIDRSRDRLLQWRGDSIAPGLHQGHRGAAPLTGREPCVNWFC